MLYRARIKASEDAPEETRWFLRVPTLSGEPVTTYARNFAWVGALTVAVPAVGAWFLTRDGVRTAGVAAIGMALHLLRYLVPVWAWTAAAMVGCGVMMWLLGGGIGLIVWAVSAVLIVQLAHRQRRESEREGGNVVPPLQTAGH